MTLAEYERLPAHPGSRWELHHGKAVFVAFPVHAYKPLRDHELWGADVAVVSSLHDKHA